MGVLTPETPLGQAVQAVLLSNPSGLAPHEIRRKLRREQSLVVSESQLQELLSHARIFTMLSDGRYVLAGGQPEPPAPPPVHQPNSSPPLNPYAQPLLANLPRARHTYVVFDLETTGLQPGQDRILQIAALKIVAGRPVAARNWYVNPGDTAIPYSLQITLGLDHNPALRQTLAAAPALSAVLPDFLQFVADLPLVAYNARFDGRFLKAALGETALSNPLVDGLELALLLRPNLPHHRLADVAAAVGLDIDDLQVEWQALPLEDHLGTHTISRDTLHNALTDVYVLHRVYQRLLEILETSGPAHDLLRALLPEAFQTEAAFAGVAETALAAVRGACDWSLRPNETTPPPELPSPSQLIVGALAARGRQPRPGQLDMQASVAHALAQNEYAMIEAPTGTGKTLAYLTAAVHHALHSGQRVALSTSYRNLQDQLLEEISTLQAHGPVRFRSQLLKGVGNYLCWSQIGRYLEAGAPGQGQAATPLSLAERFVLAYVCLWLPGSAHGAADELSHWLLETLPIANGVVHQLQASAACGPDLHPDCSACPMPAAYANAQQAEIVVLNHALWLSDAHRLPPFAHLVLDEAHTLEDVATSALTQEVSADTLTALLDHLYDSRTNRGLLVRLRASTTHAAVLSSTAGAISAVRRVRNLVEDFGPYLVQFIRRVEGPIDPQYGASYRLAAPPDRLHGPAWQRVDQAHQQLFGLHLGDLLAGLTQIHQSATDALDLRYRVATLHELTDLMDALSAQRQLAHDLIRVSDQNLVYWVEVGPPQDPDNEVRDFRPDGWAFKAAPIDVGQALQPHYDRLASVSFVSATLALRGNDFSYFVARLGLAHRLGSQQIRQLPPVLPYAHNVFLGLTDYFTYAPLPHTQESFVQELAGELGLFLRFTAGRTLGLFTARSRMETIAQRIEPVLSQAGLPLYVQTPGASRRRLLDDFKAQEESVLFGLRSFWEGVDVPGPALSFVAMEKLPFPLLVDPIHRARAEAISQRGQSEFDDYLLPLMLLQFKQGFGRLLRAETDRGAVVLFDKRIHRKSYKADLLASLPGFRPRDDAAEHSRRGLYAALADAFPDLFDQAPQRDVLAGLPAEILPDLEAALEQLSLPDTIALADFDHWRPILLAALKRLFGHDDFRTVAGEPAQERVIQHMLAGEDVLGILPTGSGKSLTFQLPALLRQGVTLVFSPLIALMKDQVGQLNEKGIEVVGAIYSGQTAGERDDVLERMRRGRARLVYISPERLRDPQLLLSLQQTRILQVVVDEAHCVAMWGPSFRPDFLYLPRLFEVLGYRPPLLALTATATPPMQSAIIQALELRHPARVNVPIDRPELIFGVFNARSRYGAIHSRPDRLRQLMRILEAADRDRPPILIYAATTVQVDQLAHQLRAAGYDARAYHGKMLPAERTSVQDMFMDDHINIVVCTKAFGMGIDKPDIRYVIHYQMPGDLESYFQEAGRAGRDGAPAYCLLLYHPSDIHTQEYFIDNNTPDAATINEVLQALLALPGPILYVDPEELEQRLGLEEVQLKVALHHLEAQGFIRRSADFSLTGELTFHLLPEDAARAWQASAEPGAADLERLLSHARWSAYRKQEIQLLALAQDLSISPETIEGLLLRLAARGEIVYRPWRRGFVLHKVDRPHPAEPIAAGDLAAEEHRAELHAKLKAMEAYATGNAECRRATVLRYFGQSTPQYCQGCDVCQPETEWPWSLITARDFATPDAYFDPANVVLETVRWNLDRAERYGAPYGTSTLMAILVGNEYSAAGQQNDPHLKEWRLKQVRNCPHWGVFSLLPARDRVLAATVERLQAEDYLSRAQQPFADGGEYDYLALTDKGRSQLASGRLLQWNIQ